MNFPELLQEAQERLGFTTRTQFAAFLGIAPSQLTYYMKGMEPRLRSLESIAAKLGLELFVTSLEAGTEPRQEAPIDDDDTETRRDEGSGQVIPVDFHARQRTSPH
jgi:transcriptional regulator with XRE-family HTH domain